MNFSFGFSDYQVIDTACKQLAHVAAKQTRLQTKEGGIAVAQLFEIRRTIDSIQELLAPFLQRCIKLPPSLSMTKCLAKKFHIEHCFFGRLIQNESVETLAGNSLKAPIYRPVQLTLVADKGKVFFDIFAY